MQDSMTMAEAGSIVKVSGSRIATPFGPPNPGNTPTKMPSTSPTSMAARVLRVRTAVRQCSSRPRACIASLVAESRFERAFRHDDVECDVEGDEHDDCEQERGEHRLPQRNAPNDAHEASDQEKTGDVEPEPLREQAKQQRGDEDFITRRSWSRVRNVCVAPAPVTNEVMRP